MTRLAWLILGCSLTWNLQAQESTPEEAAPADAVVTEEAPPAAEAGVEATAETTGEATGETTGEPEAPAEAAAEEAPAVEREPWKLYAGLDQVQPTLYLSNATMITALGSDEFDSSFYRLRAGIRLFETIGIEVQLGQDDEDGAAPGKFQLSGYKAAFFVPTGVLFEMIEVAGLLGYTQFDAERGGFTAELGGPAYGVNVELPLRLLSETLPDVRIGGGYMVYDATNDARVAGAHFGLRYDFQL